MFSTLYGTYFPFQMHFKMLSAICFNLDQSKILTSGNGLNPLFTLALPYNKVPTITDPPTKKAVKLFHARSISFVSFESLSL